MKLNIFKRFSLKNHYREKKTKCNIVPHIDSFFTNLIIQQKNKLSLLLDSKNNWNMEFLLRASNINNLLYKDSDISMKIMNKIESQKENIRNKNSFYYVIDSLLFKYQVDTNSVNAKELIREIINKSYLITENELIELLSRMNVSKQDITEHRENFLKRENEYTKKLSIKDNNFSIRLSNTKERITITSKKFNKKIILIALNDNKMENVLKSYEYIDKYKPNVILFQKKPIYNLENNNKYTGLLEKNLLASYIKEVLHSEKYSINNVERLVMIYNLGL